MTPNWGGAGLTLLLRETGDDYLTGGADADVLTGGTGSRYVFNLFSGGRMELQISQWLTILSMS